MHKLRLNLEELAVETFTTDTAASRVGTVRGQELPYSDTTCDQRICDCPSEPSDCGTCPYHYDTTDETQIDVCMWSAPPSYGYSYWGTCVGETCDWIVGGTCP